MSQHPAEGLSFLLPVHNQAGILEHVLSVWSGTLEKLGRPYEILLIDDASSDATGKLLEGGDGKHGLLARIPHLQVIRQPERLGFGAAIRSGVAVSQHPLIFYTGCDYSYTPADIKRLLHRIEDSHPETKQKMDVVNGYRCGTPVTGWPKLVGRAWRGLVRVVLGMPSAPRPGWLGGQAHRYALLVRAFFGLRIGDVNSKFKLFRKKIFERIPIQSNGDFVHAEILAKANFLACLMDELPIAEKPGPFPAHLEPPSPMSLGRDLRRVFFHPDFGPAVIEPKIPVAV